MLCFLCAFPVYCGAQVMLQALCLYIPQVAIVGFGVPSNKAACFSPDTEVHVQVLVLVVLSLAVSSWSVSRLCAVVLAGNLRSMRPLSSALRC